MREKRLKTAGRRGPPRYRRLRLSNRRFAATVGGAPGGIGFLETLGFARDRGRQQGAEALLLRRDDPGLLWLGKATLEAERQREPYRAAKATLDAAEQVSPIFLPPAILPHRSTCSPPDTSDGRAAAAVAFDDWLDPADQVRPSNRPGFKAPPSQCRPELKALRRRPPPMSLKSRCCALRRRPPPSADLSLKSRCCCAVRRLARPGRRRRRRAAGRRHLRRRLRRRGRLAGAV